MRFLIPLAALAVLAGPSWGQCLTPELQPAGLPADANFGTSAARDGDSLFVGAPGDSTNGSPTGAVYWYRQAGPLEWVLEDRFPGIQGGGRAVAVDGQWAAYSTGGGVQMLVRSGPQTWALVDFIPGVGVHFGDALDLVDGPTPRLVIGMPGAPFTEQTPQVWRFTGSAWVHEHTFAPLDGEFAQYGFDVTIDEPFVLIGAPGDFDAGPGVGSIYVYFRSGAGTWVQTQELLPTWAGPQNFGTAIDASAEGLIAGAPGSNPRRYSLWRRTNGFYTAEALSGVLDDTGGNAVAMDGDRAVIKAGNANIRMVERDPVTSIWSFHTTAFGLAQLGDSVDLDGGRIVAGRPMGPGSAFLSTFIINDCNANDGDDLCDLASGLDGDADGDGILNGCDCETFEFCEARPNSTGNTARIGSEGTPSVSDNAFKLVADNIPPGVPGLYFYGMTEIQLPFGDGFRCVGGPVTRLQPPVATEADGTSTRTIDFTATPTNFVSGDTRKFQLWYRDPMGPGGSGFNLTPGLSVSFCQ